MRTVSRTNSASFAVIATIALALISVPAAAQQQFTAWVEMPDGVLLATEVYLPAESGSWPVVVSRTPYGREDPSSIYTDDGYAYVAQDIRGFGDSQGEWFNYGRETEDGHATLDWIALQPWCDGNIEVGGYSFPGMTTYALAAGASDAVKSLRGEAATPDSYHHMAFQGGAFREAFIVQTASLLGRPELIDEMLEHRLLDEYWEPMQWIDDAAEVDAPMLHIGGWYDIYQQGTLDGFAAYQHLGGDGARGRQHLIMGPWTHEGFFSSTVQGSLRYPENSVIDSDVLRADFRDHHLKGLANGVAEWPPVQIYVMGAAEEEGAPGNRWVGMSDWPPAADTQRWYLDATGGLAAETPAAGEVVLTIDPDEPVDTIGGANHHLESGPRRQFAAEIRDDVLTFTSEVLAEPVTIIGPVTARIWIRPDTYDLDLSVRLCDVYPQGGAPFERSFLVIDGIQRARMRCADDRECLLEPGVPTEIEVVLWSTALIFNAGHQIRVSIAGSNDPRFEVNPNHGGDLNGEDPIVVAYPAILFGPDYPSHISLPVVRLPIEVRGTPVEHPLDLSPTGS